MSDAKVTSKPKVTTQKRSRNEKRLTPKEIAAIAIKDNPRLKGKNPADYAKARIRPMLRKMRDNGELKKLDANAQTEPNAPWRVNAKAYREVLQRISK